MIEMEIKEKFEVRAPLVLECEGQKIFATLHLPVHASVAQKVPGVLMCHGLGGNKSGKYRSYVILSTLLAHAGIASLRLDFRGAGDSEGLFEEMTVESQVQDALAGIEELKDHPCIDAQRLGIYGRSFGGVIAVLAARRSALMKSVVLWAPIFSGTQWLDRWNQFHACLLPGAHRMREMTVEGQLAGYLLFKQLFDLNLEEELLSLQDIPLLHIHGDKDTIVTPSHAEDYARCRAACSLNSRFIRLPSSDHEFLIQEEKKLAQQATIEWFKTTL